MFKLNKCLNDNMFLCKCGGRKNATFSFDRLIDYIILFYLFNHLFIFYFVNVPRLCQLPPSILSKHMFNSFIPRINI